MFFFEIQKAAAQFLQVKLGKVDQHIPGGTFLPGEFYFIGVPKTGSTSIETAFHEYIHSQVTTGKRTLKYPHLRKHYCARQLVEGNGPKFLHSMPFLLSVINAVRIRIFAICRVTQYILQFFLSKVMKVKDANVSFFGIGLGKLTDSGYGMMNTIFLSPWFPDTTVEWHPPIPQDELQRTFKFGFVRDPFSHVKSMYYRTLGLDLVRNVMPFEDFCRTLRYCTDTSRMPYKFRNQYDFFTDSQGNCVVDKIYRLEDMQDAIPDIAERLGLKTLQVLHENKSRVKREGEVHTAETKQQIADLFAKDIAMFGYAPLT